MFFPKLRRGSSTILVYQRRKSVWGYLAGKRISQKMKKVRKIYETVSIRGAG